MPGASVGLLSPTHAKLLHRRPRNRFLRHSGFEKIILNTTGLVTVVSGVTSPADLESVFGLTGGNIMQGAMSLSSLAFMRPLPGYADYRTPIRGLYLCGAATHPGGGVMGACGYNAAREILKDG